MIYLSTKSSSLAGRGELVDKEEIKKTQKEKYKLISAYFYNCFSAIIILQTDTIAWQEICNLIAFPSALGNLIAKFRQAMVLL